MGHRNIFPLDRECEDHVYCVYEFPGPRFDQGDPHNKIGVTYSSINGNGFGGYGETVLGTAGTLILEREQEVMLFKNSSTATSVTVKKGKDGRAALDTTESKETTAAIGKRRSPCLPFPRCSRSAGASSARATHCGRISLMPQRRRLPGRDGSPKRRLSSERHPMRLRRVLLALCLAPLCGIAGLGG